MGQFHLLFSSEPPAVDAIRHDFIIFDNVDEATHEVVEGQEYKFKLLKCTIKKKPVYEIIRGRVLRSGTKTYLESLNVNSEGEILGIGAGLKGRKKELAAQKAKQQQAQATLLQDVAEDMLQNGPKQVSRLPKERSEALKDEIKEKMSTLPCFQNDGTKIEILRGKGVFLDAGKIGVLRQELGDQPDKHYQALLNLTLQPILGTDGVSVKGKRNCVAVTDKLTETLLLYTTQVYMGCGGNRNDIKFKPNTKLKNLLSNSKKRKKVVARSSVENQLDSSVENQLESSVENQLEGSVENQVEVHVMTTPSRSTLGENSSSPSFSPEYDMTSTPRSGRFATLKPVTPDHQYFKRTRTLTMAEM